MDETREAIMERAREKQARMEEKRHTPHAELPEAKAFWVRLAARAGAFLRTSFSFLKPRKPF